MWQQGFAATAAQGDVLGAKELVDAYALAVDKLRQGPQLRHRRRIAQPGRRRDRPPPTPVAAAIMAAQAVGWKFVGPAVILDEEGARMRLGDGTPAMLKHLFVRAYRRREEAIWGKWLGDPGVAWEPGRKALAKLHRAGCWQSRRALLQLLASQPPTGERLAQLGA